MWYKKSAAKQDILEIFLIKFLFNLVLNEDNILYN